MKKKFNQTKRPVNSRAKESDWYESLEDDYTDDDYEVDEDYEADGDYTDEDYTDEDYSDEDYADEEVAEETAEIEAEELAGGLEAVELEEEFFEDKEAPVEEVPDEEMFDGEITYVEDAADEDYPDQEITYEDDDFYIAEFEEKTPKPKKKKAAAKLSAMDAVIMITGVAVLALALFTGAFYLSSKTTQKQVSDLVAVGTQLSGINMIGEKGIFAIAEATTARINAASMVEEEVPETPDEPEEYEEIDYTRKINVVMNMSSIQKDLKIKFTNENTGKLVANVPFSITVVDPSGKSVIWSDDDMDGIIYKKDITPGTYKITMEELTDSRYANYSVSTMTRTTDVKKDIAYVKVDLSGEIKSESEIDAKKEDTKKNETAVESALTDTVAWVESKALVSVYSEYAKSQIPDPLTLLEHPIEKPEKTAMLTSLFRRAAIAAKGKVTPDSKKMEIGEKITLKAESAATSDAETETVTGVELSDVVWTSSKEEVATVDSNGVVTAVKAGEATITFTAKATVTYSVKSEETGNPPIPEATPNPEDPEATASPEATSTPEATESAAEGTSRAVTTKTEEVTVSASCVVTVNEAEELKKGSIAYEKDEYIMPLKEKLELNVKAKDFLEGKELAYTVKTEPADIITAAVDEKGKLVLTAGEKHGVVKVTVTANYKEGGTKETEATTTLTVTAGSETKIVFEKETISVYAEVPFVLNGILEKTLTKNPTVTVASVSEEVLKAKAEAIKVDGEKMILPITLEGVKEGTVNITVVVKEGDVETKLAYAVTVLPNPKKDTKTELTDALGNLIYVLENNEYRQATFADYYTFDKFFVKGEEKYTGWQTIDGKVYFFTADGKKVTGEQVIQGAKYNFASDGTLVTGTGALGIDVSKWNSTIDWNAVKNSGVNYAIIRCGYRGSTEGKLVIDPKFVANIKGATAVGIKVGVYFFTQAIDEREAVEEASMVLEQVKNYKISYPIFLDVEPSGGRGDKIDSATRTAVCKAFCQTIQNAGYTAGIYANKNWLETKLDPSQLGAYKIWLAQYAAAPTYTGRYDLWQYRATGKVSGISGDVDMNLSYLGY